MVPNITDPEALELIMELPGEHNPIVEDEIHVLKDCPMYENIRMNLNNTILDKLRSGNLYSLFNEDNIKNLANYVNKISKLRFPKKEPDQGDGTKNTT